MFRSTNKGMSIIEMAVAVAILAGVFVVAGGSIPHLFKQNAVISSAADEEVFRRTLRNNLTQVFSTSLSDNIFVSPSLFSALSLGWYVTQFGVPDGAAAGIFLAPNTIFVNSTPTTTALPFFAVICFQRDDTAARLPLSTDLTLTPAQSADGATFTIPVTGSTTQYAIGDLLALSTPVGTEFVQVTQLAPSSFTVAVHDNAGLPVNALPSGIWVYRTKITLIGVANLPTGTLVFNHLDPSSGALSAQLQLPFHYPIQSALVQNLSNPQNLQSWVTAGAQSVPANQSNFLFRFIWQRPSLDRGVTSNQVITVNNLDVAL